MRCSHQAVEYAKIRTQFGQPIGAFQGIKHQLATCAVAIEFAKPVVWRAAAAMQDGLESAPVHVSHAKMAATDAAMLTAETAIQVHGAMGYTYEVDLHFWMKRTWALAGAWGDRAFHLKRVDEAVLGGTLADRPRTHICMKEPQWLKPISSTLSAPRSGARRAVWPGVHPADLGAHPIKALVERTGIDAKLRRRCRLGLLRHHRPAGRRYRPHRLAGCRAAAACAGHDDRPPVRIEPAGRTFRRARRDERHAGSGRRGRHRRR